MTIPPCSHRPPCPGCPRYGEDGVAATVREKVAALANRAGGVSPVFHDAPALGARHRARLMVRGRTSTPKIGLFQAGSHRIADIPECRIHHPQLNRMAAAVKEGARRSGVHPYADRPHRGALRAVQGVVERASGRVQLVLVENAEQPEQLDSLVDYLRSEHDDWLHSLWWNGQPERSNAILGENWKHLAGPDVLWESYGDCRIAFPPGAFGQSQPHIASSIVDCVQGWVPEGRRVLELYSGCGPLGVGLLGRALSVVFNEASPAGLEGLRRSIEARPSHEQQRARVLPGPATDHVDALGEADIVIADPPRKGLDTAWLDALIAAPPEALLWVSCGLEAFLAQSERLLGSGALRLRNLEAFPQFPFTEHAEIVTRWER